MSPSSRPRDAASQSLRVVLLSLHWVEYLIELANALARRGHRVGIVLARDRVRQTVGDQLAQVLDPRVTSLVVRDHPTGLRDPRQLVTAARILAFVRRMRPDVLHLQDSTNGILALCLPAWRSLPLVLTVHDVTTHPGRDSSGPGRRAAVRESLRARADAVVVHGESLKSRYLEAYGIDADRVHSVPHGCYGIFRHWARPEARREPQTILFFGRIELYKGLGHLIDAFRIVRDRCPGARLIVAGGGDDLLRHRAVLDALPGCELHAGYVPTEKVAELFQRASVAVLPYIEGSQSGVTRIAYPFGVPVVVTDVGSIPESVDAGRSGLIVPPGDTRALADALSSILTDAGLRERLSRGASDMAAGTMSWDTVAARQEAVLRAVSARPIELLRSAR